MGFNVDCPCGKAIAVTAAQAGSEVRCECGQINAVPPLSELRRAVGQSQYNQGIADRIRQRVAEGALPAEQTCAGCGAETGGVLELLVECERAWNAGGGFWKHFFLFLLAPFWIWGHLRKDYSHPEVFGRETVVQVSLRLCAQCQAAARRSGGARAMRALLQRVPLCAELLREYPEATVVSSDRR